ncbi:MAG: gamma carbonic anhydrase family protein [Spirochaetales bacterium]
MIHKIKNVIPKIHQTAFIAWNAEVAGDAELGENVSVWFSATLRADIAPIKIGKNSNIQDNAVIHVDNDVPCIVEDNVTVGHGVILHSCTVKEGASIGMGAIVLNGAVIGKNCIVGAHALVTKGKIFDDNMLIMGSPAKAVRSLTTEEIAAVQKNTEEYVLHGQEAKSSYVELKL